MTAVKYKLLKDIIQASKWTVFEYRYDDWIHLSLVEWKWLWKIGDLIQAIWIINEEYFEEAEEYKMMMVPEKIHILYDDDLDEFWIWNGKQFIYYDKEWKQYWIYPGYSSDDTISCELIKTTFWELEVGDMFYDNDIDAEELSHIGHYNIKNSICDCVSWGWEVPVIYNMDKIEPVYKMKKSYNYFK